MNKTHWENGERVPITRPNVDEIDDEPSPSNPALIMLRRIIGELLADSNPALGVECMAVIISIGYQGDSLAKIGQRHGVCRATVSKRCVDLSEAFGLQPARVMRRIDSREKSRNARLKVVSDQ